MAKHILKCQSCGTYTLEEECPGCHAKCVEARPPKYSPDDKYGKFRRQAKEAAYREKGLI